MDQEVTRRIQKATTFLDLSGLGLTKVPNELGQLTELTTLSLSENQLTEVPKELGKLTKLTTLSLSGNQLTEVPNDLGELTNLTILALSGNQLTEVPKELGKLTNLTTLSLYRNQLTEVPKELGQLTNLKKLSLYRNQLIEVPKELGELTNLIDFSLSENQLIEVPKELGKLTNLRTLSLSENQLVEVPIELGKLTNLRTLSLSENQLIEVPKELGNLYNLRELSLYRNQLTEVPKELGKLTNLRTLSLSENQLVEVPIELGQLNNLITLSLYGNQLTEVPKELGKLTNLRTFFLYRNQLTEVPKELGKLTNLITLTLYCNQLTEVPKELEKLINMRTLSLYKNQLIRVPKELGKLNNLMTFSLYDNQLTEVPKELGELTNLKELSLSKNQLVEVPKELGQLINLTTLSLSENQLIEVPNELGQLTKLTTLSLSGNQLVEVPKELRQLTNLTTLSLSKNQLKTIPNELWQLTNLRKLSLDHNQLKEVPKELGKLTNLEEVFLSNNPLIPEQSAAYDQGLKAFLTYLQEQSDEQIVLNEAKLIFIGEGEVGKTSLLGALRGDEWIENRETTHGVEVDIKSLVATDASSDTEITFNGWDFGGQNIYRHTHQLFFTAPAVYLTVWNPRRGPEQCRVNEWIKMVKHRAYDDSQPELKPYIYVVATHGGPKERLDHIDEQAIREEFSDLIVGFHHVDSKTRTNLDELKQNIAHTAAQISQVGRTVPASWKRVLEAIRQRSQIDPWITYEEFQILCSEQQVDLSLAKTYAAILNELGHLIHYSTDPILKDTVILKPEWLSKAVSFVLEDPQVKNQNGLVRHSRLSQLWNDPDRDADRYLPNLHPVFLKLMEHFDLSYQVELPDLEAEPTNLIAQLVPSKRPDDWEKDWKLNPDDTERTQVCRLLDKETGRTVEAEGLMYRLIVRLHRYSLGRQNYYDSRHWKYGLILDDGFNGRAFIEEIGGDIYVTVRAAYPNSFLGHLCSEIEWLIKSFWKGIDPRLYLPCPTNECKGLLERDEILECRHEGISKVRCTVCKTFHNIDELMATRTVKPEWHVAVSELKQGQQQILNAFDNGFDSLSGQLKTLMSQADEQYEALLTTLIDPAKDGPRLFSLEPIDPSFWEKPNWISKKFRVTLWCEHRRLPLPILNGEGDTNGVYVLDITRDWLKRASPLLRVLSVTLKLTLPIVIPGTQLATDDSKYEAITEQLKFGVKSAISLQSGGEQIGDWLIEGDASELSQASTNTIDAIRAQGTLLRELHALLKEKDPGNSFGGLERVQNKRKEFLWVHPKYVSEYGTRF